MEAVAVKRFNHATLGAFAPGDRLAVNEEQAKELSALGVIDIEKKHLPDLTLSQSRQVAHH